MPFDIYIFIYSIVETIDYYGNQTVDLATTEMDLVTATMPGSTTRKNTCTTLKHFGISFIFIHFNLIYLQFFTLCFILFVWDGNFLGVLDMVALVLLMTEMTIE